MNQSCGLVVIAIASDGRDTEFESHLNCLLREREILRMRSQSATRKENYNHKKVTRTKFVKIWDLLKLSESLLLKNFKVKFYWDHRSYERYFSSNERRTWISFSLLH